MRCLVTAIGGDIGQAIAKILRTWKRADWIIGTDTTLEHAGGFFVDELRTVPRADAPGYLDEISEIVAKERIDVVIPVNENELRIFLSAHQSHTELKHRTVLPRAGRILECFDKHDCIRMVESFGLQVPWTRLAGESPLSLPCIMKRRRGAGSKGLIELRTQDELEFYRRRNPECVLQEKLGPADQEYTCGVYRARDGSIRCVSLRRRLSGGLTGYAEVVDVPSIRSYCRAIAENLGLLGSINVQLILTARGPELFEINPRFSSTVGFRHQIGFQDLLWSIQSLLGEAEAPVFESTRAVGQKFYRVFSECYC